MISTEYKLKDETPHFAKPVLSAGAEKKLKHLINNLPFFIFF